MPKKSIIPSKDSTNFKSTVILLLCFLLCPNLPTCTSKPVRPSGKLRPDLFQNLIQTFVLPNPKPTQTHMDQNEEYERNLEQNQLHQHQNHKDHLFYPNQDQHEPIQAFQARIKAQGRGHPGNRSFLVTNNMKGYGDNISSSVSSMSSLKASLISSGIVNYVNKKYKTEKNNEANVKNMESIIPFTRDNINSRKKSNTNIHEKYQKSSLLSDGTISLNVDTFGKRNKGNNGNFTSMESTISNHEIFKKHEKYSPLSDGINIQNDNSVNKKQNNNNANKKHIQTIFESKRDNNNLKESSNKHEKYPNSPLSEWIITGNANTLSKINTDFSPNSKGNESIIPFQVQQPSINIAKKLLKSSPLSNINIIRKVNPVNKSENNNSSTNKNPNSILPFLLDGKNILEAEQKMEKSTKKSVKTENNPKSLVLNRVERSDREAAENTKHFRPSQVLPVNFGDNHNKNNASSPMALIPYQEYPYPRYNSHQQIEPNKNKAFIREDIYNAASPSTKSAIPLSVVTVPVVAVGARPITVISSTISTTTALKPLTDTYRNNNHDHTHKNGHNNDIKHMEVNEYNVRNHHNNKNDQLNLPQHPRKNIKNAKKNGENMKNAKNYGFTHPIELAVDERNRKNNGNNHIQGLMTLTSNLSPQIDGHFPPFYGQPPLQLAISSAMSPLMPPLPLPSVTNVGVDQYRHESQAQDSHNYNNQPKQLYSHEGYGSPAALEHLQPQHQPQSNHFLQNNHDQDQKHEPHHNNNHHEHHQYGPSVHEHEHMEHEDKEKELIDADDKILTKTIIGTKALKKGSLIFVAFMVLVIFILAGLATAGVAITPVIFPLALLPIGLIALALFVPLLIIAFPIVAAGFGGGKKKRRKRDLSDGVKNHNMGNYFDNHLGMEDKRFNFLLDGEDYLLQLFRGT